MSTTFPWAAGSATGIGSLPGTDPDDAARTVVGELPSLPHLPELPARGVGADMIGRGACFLADTPVDLQPAGWRLVSRPGVDSRRAQDFLARDLDAFQYAALGHAGPVKVQAAGPWTLAASLELPRGDKALSDPGAVRDLSQALAHGLAEHVAEVRRRLPAATAVVVQLDEPSLPAVLLGRVPTASGWATHRSVAATSAIEGLATVVDAVTAAGATAGVHCCAAEPPIVVLRAAGAAFLSLDAAMLTTRDYDAIGAAVDEGAGVLLGVVPALWQPTGPVSDLAGSLRSVTGWWRGLGFSPQSLGEVVVITPSCGLAGASPAAARAVMTRCRELGRALVEAPEGIGE